MKLINNRGLLLLLIIVGPIINVNTVNGHSFYFNKNTESKIYLRFGEYQGEYERSPGYLDSLDFIYAWFIDNNQTAKKIKIKKENDGFLIDEINTDVIAAQTGFPVMQRGNSKPRKPIFYARWVSDYNRKYLPCLTLDLVSNGKLGEGVLYFRGSIAAGVEVNLYTPEIEKINLVTDEDGKITFRKYLLQNGCYMIKVPRYSEVLKGYDMGKFYEIVSHNYSLTWLHSNK